jgi:hypothetical protein
MQILFPFPVKDPPLYYVSDTRHKLRITKTGEVSPADFLCSLLAHPCASILSWHFRGIGSRFSFSSFSGQFDCPPADSW